MQERILRRIISMNLNATKIIWPPGLFFEDYILVAHKPHGMPPLATIAAGAILKTAAVASLAGGSKSSIAAPRG
ncbi:MAG TPA: hypothetical protein VF451_08235 [Acidobacteriota bacterium]